MSNSKLTPDQLRFIDDLASLLGTWSMPVTAARLYGYLQLQNEPVSLDDIARDLVTSKSHACNAARILEDHGNARRISGRGSKRIFYVAGDDPGAPLRRQTETLERMAGLISGRKERVATGAALERMASLAAFHRALQEAMESVIVPHRANAAA